MSGAKPQAAYGWETTFRMNESRWLSRLLSWSAYAAAIGLLGLLAVAPFLDRGEPAASGWTRILAVFARDAVLRRTAFASALGLVATARIFFRLPSPDPSFDSRPSNRAAVRPPRGGRHVRSDL